MDTEFFVGETIHISADDLTFRDGSAVTTGATVVIAVANQEGSVVSTATLTTPSSGDDWGSDITLPTTAGSYFVSVDASKSGKTWRAKRRIIVNAF